MRSRLSAVGPESPASESPGLKSFALRPRARLGLSPGHLGVVAGLLSIQIGVGLRFTRTHDGRALDLELREPEPRGSILYLIAYEREQQLHGILGMRFTRASGSARMTLPLLVPASARLELVYTTPARVLPPRNESRHVLIRGDAVSFLAPPPG